MSLWLTIMCLCLVLAEEKIRYDNSQLLQIQVITEKQKDKLIQFKDQGGKFDYLIFEFVIYFICELQDNVNILKSFS